MDYRVLEGSRMTDRADAHAHIAEVLAFPDWYGGNLDALWDLLTELGPTALLLTDPQDLLPDDPEYREQLLDTLFQAAAENPLFTFGIEETAF